MWRAIPTIASIQREKDAVVTWQHMRRPPSRSWVLRRQVKRRQQLAVGASVGIGVGAILGGVAAVGLVAVIVAAC